MALRAIEPDDLEQLRDWRNRPNFRRHFREYREINKQTQLNWFEQLVTADPRVLMFSVVTRKASELVGCCGLVYIDWINRTADMSIYIGSGNAYIDETYAPDAARVLLDYGFRELDLHRIWTEIYDFDERKKRLLATLGFVLEGRHREHHYDGGRRHDSLFYGILRSEFDGRVRDGSRSFSQ